MGEIQKVAVIGAGTMGSGIAHVFARSGVQVMLCDVEQRFLDRALASIKTNLGREASKGKLAEPKSSRRSAASTPPSNIESLTGAEIAVEAAPERLELKSEVFRPLIASSRHGDPRHQHLVDLDHENGRAHHSPCEVIGMHFFNPVPVMALVEVVRGMATSDATFAAVRDLSIKLGKTPVEVNDAPGFVSNRVLMPLINEGAFAVMEGVATPEAIDQVFKLGMAHPMGPLTLADFIGIDVCVDILRVLQEGFGDPKYRPCPLLVRMVDAGWLGRKSGRGFFRYEKRP